MPGTVSADFIAYAVEWMEGDESNQEQPDWTFGEDVTDPVIRNVGNADEDDEEGNDYFCYHINETSDYCKNPQSSYEMGNLLPVAYRLAVVGGYNPICLNHHYPVNSYPLGPRLRFQR